MNLDKLHLYMIWYPQALFTAEQACPRFFCFEKQHALLRKVRVCEYLWQLRVSTYFRKHQIDAECNAIPCWNIFVFVCPEFSGRADWWPKRCPTFVNVLCIFDISGTVSIRGVAYWSATAKAKPQKRGKLVSLCGCICIYGYRVHLKIQRYYIIQSST